MQNKTSSPTLTSVPQIVSFTSSSMSFIQIRHFHGATRIDENVTIQQSHCAQRIIHVVLSLTSRLFHILSSSMLSLVSTSSMTVFVFPRVWQSQSGMLPVFRFSNPSSTLAHHWLHSCASSNTFIVAFCSTMQYPSPIDQSSTHFQISPTRF